MSDQSNGNHDKDGRLIQVAAYTDGRTKQSFRDETDINKILKRAQAAGTMSHLQKYSGVYGDFADFDFLEANIKLTHGREVFDALPSELRKEFNQSPAQFFEYVNDPKNAEELRKRLPQLAEPGRQNIDLSGKTPPEVTKPPTKAAPAAETTPAAAAVPAEPAATPEPVATPPAAPAS